jgi:adenylate cyclase class IV
MIRFRKIVGEELSDIVVTMKIKGDAKGFQEYFEYEYTLSNYKPEIFKKINKKLREITGTTLPGEVNITYDFKKLVRLLRSSGFSEHRLLLEKMREEYKRGDVTIEIDLLPEGIGHYIEIEAGTPERLLSYITELDLPKKNLTTSNYGGILKEYKKDCPEILMRTGLFNKNYAEYGIQ